MLLVLLILKPAVLFARKKTWVWELMHLPRWPQALKIGLVLGVLLVLRRTAAMRLPRLAVTQQLRSLETRQAVQMKMLVFVRRLKGRLLQVQRLRWTLLVYQN